MDKKDYSKSLDPNLEDYNIGDTNEDNSNLAANSEYDSQEIETILSTDSYNHIDEDYGSYDEYLQAEYGSIYTAKQWMSKILFATIIVFFAVTVMVPWYRVFQLPSFDLLSKSHQLKKNPDIQVWTEAVVIISSMSTKATGFNIDETGIIITNYHVISKKDNYFVTFANGQIFKAEIVAQYPDLDLAIIDINGDNLPYLELSSALDYVAGDFLTIIGNPLGLNQVVGDGDFIGFISVQGLDVPALAIKSPILKGNSGSPVLNNEGKVIAVVFANMGVDAKGSADEIVGLATPIDFLLSKEYFIKKE